MKKHKPPSLEQVLAFARSNRQSIYTANDFFIHYQQRNWLTRLKKPLANWKHELSRWLARGEKEAREQGY